MPITLSKRQIGDADRVGGIELMILWPEQLGPAPDIQPDYEQEATRAQKEYAEAILRATCEQHGLIPVHVRIANVHRPANLPPPGYRVHLAVILIGQRWVHALTHKVPRKSFVQ